MNSSRKESERAKLVQEKCQTLLTLMLRDEDNKYCVDCDAKGPRWASWNLGVFLCIRCAGIHRNLGVHISRVKSVNLDTWTPEQVVSLQQMGNSRARGVYEAQMPDGFRRPQTDSALESFIRAKYEQKKYVAREWVQPPPVKVNWDKEIDEEMEKQKRKKKGLSTSSPVSSTNGKTADASKLPSSFKSTPLPAPLPKPSNNSSSPKTSSRLSSGYTSSANSEPKPVETKSYSSDLLGLTTPTNGSNGQQNAPVDNTNDVFGVFLSGTSDENNTATNGQTAAVPSTISRPKEKPEATLAQQEQDFFNQVPNEKEKAKMTKDSILALYGAAPPINRLPATNQFMPQGMSNLNDKSAAFGMPFQQQPTFGGMQNAGMNNFQQLGMMQPTQSPQLLNFQQTHTAINPMTNQSTGFGNMQQANPTMQPFTQQTNANQNLFSAATSNANNIDNKFASLNLGNVWQ